MPEDRLLLKEIQEELPYLHSYENFLDYLATRRPQLFKQSVLIHDSGSLQYADRENPRVILFADGLMLGFAEDPRTKERQVEIIAFERGHGFQFAELRFSEGGPRYNAQPESCKSCHGSPGKPLWEPYDFWPNAFGSAIGRFGSIAEKEAYEQLRQSSSKTGIYTHLQWPAPATGHEINMPGIETFTQYVTQLQMFNTLQVWKEKYPIFTRLAPALLGVVNGCVLNESDAITAHNLAAYFPSTWRGHIISDFPAFHQKVKNKRQSLKAYQSRRYKNLFGDSRTLFHIDHERLSGESSGIAAIFFILKLAGVDTRDFSLSQGLNPFLISVPNNYKTDFNANMALVVLSLFQHLKPDRQEIAGYSYLRFDCDALRTESIALLAEQEVPETSIDDSFPAPTVFGECIMCHSKNPNSSGITPIPFDRTSALRYWMEVNGYRGFNEIIDRINRSGSGRMPPYRSLNKAERRAFNGNLESILGGGNHS